MNGPSKTINDVKYKLVKATTANKTYSYQLTELQANDAWGGLTDDKRRTAILTNDSDITKFTCSNIQNGVFSRVNFGSGQFFIYGFDIANAKYYRSTNGSAPTDISSDTNGGQVKLWILSEE